YYSRLLLAPRPSAARISEVARTLRQRRHSAESVTPQFSPVAQTRARIGHSAPLRLAPAKLREENTTNTSVNKNECSKHIGYCLMSSIKRVLCEVNREVSPLLFGGSLTTVNCA
ncbi:hypothetical protein BIW11_12087, partial [Tropilaelaps mercedesae]